MQRRHQLVFFLLLTSLLLLLPHAFASADSARQQCNSDYYWDPGQRQCVLCPSGLLRQYYCETGRVCCGDSEQLFTPAPTSNIATSQALLQKLPGNTHEKVKPTTILSLLPGAIPPDSTGNVGQDAKPPRNNLSSMSDVIRKPRVYIVFLMVLFVMVGLFIVLLVVSVGGHMGNDKCIPEGGKLLSNIGGSDMPHGGSDMPHGGSDMPLGGSDMPHGGSDMPHGGSDMPHGGSDMPHGGSDMPHGGSDMPHGGSDMPHDSDPMQISNQIYRTRVSLPVYPEDDAPVYENDD